MKTFTSFAAFAEHLGTLVAAQAAAEHVALDRATIVLQRAAQAKFGEYQPAAGPFAAWAELAESTKADRVAQGFPENEPLLRTGATRASIERTVGAGEAWVGSDSDILKWQELGTARIPPRSTLGSAAVEQAPKIVEIVGEAVTLALHGEDPRGGIPIRE